MALSLARSPAAVLAGRNARSTGIKAAVPRRATAVVRRAYKSGGVDGEEINKKTQEALTNTTEFIKTKWEETEDKPAAVAVTAGALLLLITASSVVDAVDKIPVVGDLVELIGVVVTGWFVYRYLIFGPDREELVSSIKSFFKKVGL